MPEEIFLDGSGGVATITLNRPDQRNAVSFDGWLALRRIAGEIERDPDVRVVVLTGAGEQAFSAGADIKDFELHRRDSKSARAYAAAFDGAMDAVEALSKPTISMIRGFCVGGGCELSTATDIRVAAEGSRFGIPVARLGILVGYREMRRLVNLVGPGNASYILLSARLLDASEALSIGLVNRVLPSGELRGFTYGMAEEMVSLAPLSQRRHKQILQTVLRNPSFEALTPEEEERPFRNFDSDDFHEGRRAFLERRPARFIGR